MKTEEFVKKIKKLGCEVEIEKYKIKLYKNFICIGEIDIYEEYSLYVRFNETTFKLKNKDQIYYLCCTYAKTSIKDRGELELSTIKHKFLHENGRNDNYLNIYKGNYYMLSDYINYYTSDDIESIKRKLNSNLEDFEIRKEEL